MSGHVQAFWTELCKRFSQNPKAAANRGGKAVGGGSRAMLQQDQYEVWMETWRAAASGCRLDGVGECPEAVLILTYLQLPAIQHVSPPPGEVVEVLVRVVNAVLAKKEKASRLAGHSGVSILEAVIDVIRDRLSSQLDQAVGGEALERSLDKLSTVFEKAIMQLLHNNDKEEMTRLGMLLQRRLEISAYKTECLRFHKSAAGSAFAAGAELEMTLGNKMPEPWHGWRHATLGWLMSGSYIDVGRGMRAAYDSPEEYAETLLRMWTLLTFYWGGGAVFPRCSHRQQDGGKKGGSGNSENSLCGNPLLEPCLAGHNCGKCGLPAVWKCCRANHDAMCARCVSDRQDSLVGVPGAQASTDIYDARVEREGHRHGSYVYYLGGLQSRKPPAIATNWKTSYRLPAAGFVGIVRLAAGREKLKRSMGIEWAEIVSYDARGGSTVDWQSRQNGRMAIRLLNAGDCPGMRGEAATALEAGSMIAIIDCRVFVPEVISVLATFAAESFTQSLKEIPFIGRLIGNRDPQEPFAMHDGQSAKDLITAALTRSEIEQIKRLPFPAREALATGILAIPSIKSLYGTQLMAFAAGLFSSVHVTQGPPGTGKSYLGVCLALALDLIRTKLQETMAMGPILVLSYKNHALDEFLMDLVNASRASNNPLGNGMLIRSGNPELPGLEKYREKTSSAETRAKSELELRVGVQKRLKAIFKDWLSCSKVLSLHAELLADDASAVGSIPAWAAEQKCAINAAAHAPLQNASDPNVVWAVCCALSVLSRLKAALFSLGDGAATEAGGGVRGNLSVDALGSEAGYNVAAKAYSVDIASAGFNNTIVADISALLPQVTSNIEHWKMRSDEPWFRLVLILESWLKGCCPPPRCSAKIREERCPFACSGDNVFCDALHKCIHVPDCSKERVAEHDFCRDHFCTSALLCKKPRSKLLGGTLCDDHLCLGCVQSASSTILAKEPHACPLHRCKLPGCLNLQIASFDFCPLHVCTICVTSGSQPGLCRMGANKPLCSEHTCVVETCVRARISGDVPFCGQHVCYECCSLGLQWCGVDVAHPDSQLCPDHRCSHADACPLPRCPSSLFCVLHSCKVCLLSASFDNLVSDAVLEDAPRNSCANHPLCNKGFPSGLQCCLPAEPPGVFCRAHNQEEDEKPQLAPDGQCNGIAKKTKKRCGAKNVDLPKGTRFWCAAHVTQKPADEDEDGDKDDDTDEATKQEMEFHQVQLQSLDTSITQQKRRLAELARSVDVAPTCQLLQCTRRVDNARCPVQICVPIEGAPAGFAWTCAAHCREPRVVANIPTAQVVESAPAPARPIVAAAEVRPAVEVIAASSLPPPPVAEVTKAEPAGAREPAVVVPAPAPKQEDDAEEDFNEPERGDVHPDEMDYNEDEDEERVEEDEENGELRRIRELTELDMEEDEQDNDDDDDDDDDAKAAGANNTLETDSIDNHAALVAFLAELSWELSPAERMQRASVLVRHAARLLVQLLRPVEVHIALARRDVAEAAANAYRVTRFIGATVVGAARRLEAIRAAQPFAVIVEEACEVMEPTLLSVLAVKSLRKLEMIGDHRQLPAFVQQCWFNLESTEPTIKKSLFERLISGDNAKSNRGSLKHAPQSGCTPLPFSILDEQRRMRKEIADITRPDYADVVTITDHVQTFQQRIGDRVAANNPRLKASRELWAGKGRSVPGVSPSVFFWDLANNKTSRPLAGLSACNQMEAEAVAGLVKYLLLCGVPPGCISIITPYKGQQRTINQELRKRKLSAFFDKDHPPPPGTTLTVSTVDRYQGDENDIVILSLVRVHPGNRFVALHNRFVVATSRARMGFFVVGSTSAVIHPEGPERSRGPLHWRRFVKSLKGGDRAGPEEDEGEVEGTVWTTVAAAQEEGGEEDEGQEEGSGKDNWRTAPERWAEGVSVYLIDAQTALQRVSKETVEFNHAAAQYAKLSGEAVGKVVAVWAIEYSPSAHVLRRYERKREALRAEGKGCDEILVFHGTPYANLRPIIVGGFKVGGQDVSIANGAVYGSGVYTAIGPTTPMGYSVTGTSVILAHGLLGSLGRDHTIPAGGADWRIFKEAAQLLPRYIVVYGNGNPVVEARAAVARSLAQALYEEDEEEGEEEGEGESAMFCQGVGAGLPICCPQHVIKSRPTTKTVTEVAHFPDAATWGAFCSEPCTHQLPCGHGCSLPCHAPTVEKHNEKCEFVYERPCARHPDVPLLCLEIKRRGNQRSRDALPAYKCLLPEQFSRPECSHRVGVECHRLDTLEAGKEQLPECEVVVGDFVHPTCNHVFPKPKCAVRRGYERQPPKCNSRVKFARPCGCNVQAACFEWQKEKITPPKCLEDVTFARPRCGHRLSLRCFEHSHVQLMWDAQEGDSAVAGDGNRAAVVVVEAGVMYGPPESAWNRKIPSCQVPVAFLAQCGHTSPDVPCCQSFDMAAGSMDPPVCKESVAIPCPICQHDIRVPCWAARELADWKPLDAQAYIRSEEGVGFREEALASAQERAQQRPLPKKLASILRHACAQVLSLDRTCDATHGVAIKCSSVLAAIWGTNSLPKCEFGTERTLKCGHVLQVPCHTKDGPEPTCKAAVPDIFTYPCGAHTVRPEVCFRLQALRTDPTLRCLEPVDTRRYRCGHIVRVKCCDRVLAERASHTGSNFSPTQDTLLIDMDKGGYCGVEELTEQCTVGVTLLYPCGHERLDVPCHEAFSIAERPEISRCEVPVTAESPLCLHSVCLPCFHTPALLEWDPWAAHGRRPEVVKTTDDFDADGTGVILPWMDEANIRETPFRPFERAHVLPACCERTVVTRRCGHRARVSCTNAYTCALGPCTDPIDLPCERCLFERRVTCQVNEGELAAGTCPPCENLVPKLCSHCAINTVEAPCYSHDVRCNTLASAVLPCGHQVDWVCGETPDPRSGEAKCRTCLLALWDASIDRANESLHKADAEDAVALGALVQQLRPRLEQLLAPLGEVQSLVEVALTRQQMDKHLKGRSITLKGYRDFFAKSASVDDVGPPPALSLDAYDVVFAEKKAQSSFDQQKQTLFGRGSELRVLSEVELRALTPNALGCIELTVGLAFHNVALDNPAPFRRPLDKVHNKNDKDIEEKKANKLAESRKKSGFDCVRLSPAEGRERFVYWTVGAALSLASVVVKLTSPCCICGDLLAPVDGASCPKSHLICFDCLGGYAKAHHDGKDVAGLKNVDGEGKLTCPVPECRHAYDCRQLTIRGSPKEVLDAIEKIKSDRTTRLAVEEAVKMKEMEMRANFERLQSIKDLDERKAHQVRDELVRKVFNLKCPRCDSVFADFDGCFALACSNQACKCGFCAWCLKDCQDDAHQHVLRCPEGNGKGYHGTQEEFQEHHRKKREKALRLRFGAENAEVQKHLRGLLEKDLKDLGITLPPAGGAAAASAGGTAAASAGRAAGGAAAAAPAGLMGWIHQHFLDEAPGFQDGDFEEDDM